MYITYASIYYNSQDKMIYFIKRFLGHFVSANIFADDWFES